MKMMKEITNLEMLEEDHFEYAQLIVIGQSILNEMAPNIDAKLLMLIKLRVRENEARHENRLKTKTAALNFQ